MNPVGYVVVSSFICSVKSSSMLDRFILLKKTNFFNYSLDVHRLMERGLLPLDVATKVFEKKQGQKLKSPVKTTSAKRMLASPAKKATPSSAKKPGSTAKNAGKKPGSTAKNAGKTTSQKKRKTSSDSDDDDDDDFVDPPKAKTKRQMAFS
jgi:hypothetical protein